MLNGLKETTMILKNNRIGVLLTNAKFRSLFIEELGWDNPQVSAATIINVGGTPINLIPVAEKRGVKILVCNDIPVRSIRVSIEKEVTKIFFEHLIIYVDKEKSQQIWQWVSREQGRTSRIREYKWNIDQSPDLLVQKIEHIKFSLEDESTLTLTGIVMKLTSAFDRDIVTRKFYKKFKVHQQNFLKQITGLSNNSEKSWYASLLLNRLMFIYFIQKRGLLDDNLNYLRVKLQTVKEGIGNNKFFNFYKSFLVRLFHDGLAKPKGQRDEKIESLIGNVPYLNGGLFEQHLLEANNNINITDMAFDVIFKFFDEYEWTLDTRSTPTNKGNEINPDVLGYIFEKYINQKEMGAYYTQEDVTEYIAKNTIIPWIFNDICDEELSKETVGVYIENCLKENQKELVYDEVQYGFQEPLPSSIEKGVDNYKFRANWNDRADAKSALQTESWRDVIHRRSRLKAVQDAIDNNNLRSVEDLVTNNLDIRRFAEEFIFRSDDIELVRKILRSIRSIKVLDPACGSGAFLFAALGILYDLYESSIERIEELEHTSSGNYFTEGNQHIGNRSYFIYKSIIVNNLYGVDIMDEAVEICKLRLFLKLAAFIDRYQEIEPLPDVDFNIRAGNSLVGFTSIEQLKRFIEIDGLDFDDRKIRMKREFLELDKEINEYRNAQTRSVESAKPIYLKEKIVNRLQNINKTLNWYLAIDYGLVEDKYPSKSSKFDEWIQKHKPFNWITEFHEIVAGRGFDVIIGNPPYLEFKDIDYVPKKLRTFSTKAVHAYFIERADELLSTDGNMSMILPMSLVCTNRMRIVQKIIETNRTTWYANFSWRPGKLFEEVNRALTIFTTAPNSDQRLFTTGYIKWASEARDILFRNLYYTEVSFRNINSNVPKFQHGLEPAIMEKLLGATFPMEKIFGGGAEKNVLYFRKQGGLYWKVFTNFKPKFFNNGIETDSSTQDHLFVKKDYDVSAAVAIYSSSTFWWWLTVTTDLHSVTPKLLKSFKVFQSLLVDPELSSLGLIYIEDLKKHSKMLTCEQSTTGTTQTQSFVVRYSKPIIDSIDECLSRYYGFTESELDFIQNYDIKFRAKE